MRKRKQEWEYVYGDEEFGALFVGRKIVQTAAWVPDDAPYVEADLFWQIDDGTWIAMHLANGSRGCDTCGHGADEKAYYVLRSRKK